VIIFLAFLDPDLLCRAILASFLLNEELGHLGRVGCTLSLIGSLIIVLHAPEDKEVETVDEILEYAAQPGPYRLILATNTYS
jgi:magnesium transporter